MGENLIILDFLNKSSHRSNDKGQHWTSLGELIYAIFRNTAAHLTINNNDRHLSLA